MPFTGGAKEEESKLKKHGVEAATGRRAKLASAGPDAPLLQKRVAKVDVDMAAARDAGKVGQFSTDCRLKHKVKRESGKG